MSLAVLPTGQNAKDIEIEPIACRMQAHKSPKGSGRKPEYDKAVFSVGNGVKSLWIEVVY